ncbi:hypothetical protein BV22DRAFT_1128017 [Leucogyrophana mollusca]|uniref:Uncharacterized protein n=1 Tax=Leucogyrophana mollusca TaxID=85980 RepID=A0ACB8BL94_9AGAM|nr:hypothetical protein BV22DRAFT_1128017 [Leucogyrophana mollusca]
MRFTALIFALASAVAVTAQQNFTIMVGANKTTTFTPSYINATTGDTITFQFVAGNHTLTQSSFASPCANISTPMTGIDSGFMPVSANATMPADYSFKMTNDSTMWFYCRQTGHCQKGMVFAINPTAQKTFAMFQQAAEASGTTMNSTTGSSSSTSPSPSGSGTGTGTGTGGAMSLSSSAVGVMGVVGLLSALLV